MIERVSANRGGGELRDGAADPGDADGGGWCGRARGRGGGRAGRMVAHVVLRWAGGAGMAKYAAGRMGGGRAKGVGCGGGGRSAVAVSGGFDQGDEKCVGRADRAGQCERGK